MADAGARLAIETDTVRAIADNLDKAGTALAAQLAAIVQRMADNEPGIGTNSGAAEFALNYGVAAAGLKASAANVEHTLKAFGTSATEAVADYERTDREHQDAIRRAAGE